MSDQTEEVDLQSKKRRIKQLIFATNFGAVFVDDEGGEPWVDTILAWALVSDAPGQAAESADYVVGLVADGRDIVFADDFPNFAGYLSPDSSLDDWRRRLEEEESESRGRPETGSVLLPKPRVRW
jgi:hypothetical protein